MYGILEDTSSYVCYTFELVMLLEFRTRSHTWDPERQLSLKD